MVGGRKSDLTSFFKEHEGFVNLLLGTPSWKATSLQMSFNLN